MKIKGRILGLMALFCTGTGFAQDETINLDPFKQLKQELATPNVYRTASGAPGHEYYQQKADYVINVELDDENQIVRGEETITYYNNSPDDLEYLWVQLDQNVRQQESLGDLTQTNTIEDMMSFDQVLRLHNDFDGGFKLEYVKDASNKDLDYTVNYTMLRVNLATPLKSGSSFTLKIKWWYNINDRMEIGGRSGYEYFEEEDNYLYTIAQFYPRMAVYNEVEGWQNKQFLGSGEFTLTFGDFKVNITVPADHIVASTGELTNASSVLTSEQRARLKTAASEFEQPVMIVTPEEALANESSRSTETKTWTFEAENVRDFAFASSRKFIWDAMAVKCGNNTPMAMSFYPKEGNPLWEQYSTKVVAHTLKTYSKYTIDYPYPVAISVHSDRIGMEYPMICFNGGRPEADGTYSERTKYAMIGVIIHEVGHNFFPMIINSDERQWTWMDEGLNTFVQYLTEQEWERGYPSRRGPAANIVDYMKGDQSNIMPIMTNSESLLQFGNNAYGKPATALNILRETILGRELFDYAFKTYAERWAFKHPTPADLFRTLEDASAVDLDWFWRGWFYSTDYVDLAITDIQWFQIDTRDPAIEKAFNQQQEENAQQDIGTIRNAADIGETYEEGDPSVYDFYDTYDPFEVTLLDEMDYETYLNSLTDEELEILNAGYNYYQIDFENLGGLVMPILLQFTFTDGTTGEYRIPAEIWRKNATEVSKVFYFEKELAAVAMDPWLETADVDLSNNFWPPQIQPSRFQLYKGQNYGWGSDGGENPMQRDERNQEMEEGQE